jgi:hypothetical protein
MVFIAKTAKAALKKAIFLINVSFLKRLLQKRGEVIIANKSNVLLLLTLDFG